MGVCQAQLYVCLSPATGSAEDALTKTKPVEDPYWIATCS